MSRRKTILTASAFGAAIVLAGGSAWVAASAVERTSHEAVTTALGDAGLDWAGVETDGLHLILTGFAPDERARFRAVTEAGRVVDPGRVIDAMDLVERDGVQAPRFSLEILRNEDAVSVIGLVPSGRGAEPLATLAAVDGLTVTDMVDRADYETPANWLQSVRFALTILDRLPRAKISVEPGKVAVTAVADSDLERRQLETSLTDSRPDAVELVMDIAAPRPVITPFTLRFTMPREGEGRARFAACTVDSESAREQILTAARAVGFNGNADCVIGLGVPSASWADATSAAIATLGQIGGGTLTLSDADVTLVALEGTAPSVFERAAAELETELPDIFSLSAILPEDPEAQTDAVGGVPEFSATLSPEGQVQLRGRLFDEAQEQAVLSYGRALFGVQSTYIATRQDETLPEGWPARVLAGMEALSWLENGAVIVRPDIVQVRGTTGNSRAEADISRMLSGKLGAEAEYELSIDYKEELDPLLNIPTPEECVVELNQVLTEKKLTFPPGETVIEADGELQLGQLNEVLERCERSVFEIGGHTDSQGRETMNQQLSQARADAVRAALISRGAPPSQLIARGYGEAEPVADNETEAGREANRRITFTLAGRRDRNAPETEDAGAPGEEAE